MLLANSSCIRNAFSQVQVGTGPMRHEIVKLREYSCEEGGEQKVQKGS